MRSLRTRFLAAIVAGSLTFTATPAAAQAWHYAAFQPAGATPNEVNVLISFGGDYGTAFVGQYRWLIDKRTQIWADVGVATPSGSTPFLIGVAGAWNFVTPTKDTPIDVSATLGLYGAFANGSNIIRVPIGLDVGHTWTLSNGHDLSGFAYPRLSIDFCSSGCSDTKANLNFDLGASYDFTKVMVGRAAFTFGAVGDGDSQAGFGISLAFKTK